VKKNEKKEADEYIREFAKIATMFAVRAEDAAKRSDDEWHAYDVAASEALIIATESLMEVGAVQWRSDLGEPRLTSLARRCPENAARLTYACQDARDRIRPMLSKMKVGS